MPSIDYFVGFLSEPEDIGTFLEGEGFKLKFTDNLGNMHYYRKPVFVCYTPVKSFISSDSTYWTEQFQCKSPVRALARADRADPRNNDKALEIAAKLAQKYSNSVLGKHDYDSDHFSIVASKKKHS